MSIRVIPELWLPEGGVSEPVEGSSGKVYGWTKKHPTKPGYVFPHPDDPPAVIDAWCEAWELARRDIFECIRRWGFPVPGFRVVETPDAAATGSESASTAQAVVVDVWTDAELSTQADGAQGEPATGGECNRPLETKPDVDPPKRKPGRPKKNP